PRVSPSCELVRGIEEYASTGTYDRLPSGGSMGQPCGSQSRSDVVPSGPPEWRAARSEAQRTRRGKVPQERKCIVSVSFGRWWVHLPARPERQGEAWWQVPLIFREGCKLIENGLR